MKRAHRRQQGKGGLELIEESVHLLRTAPVGALAAYYLGGLPFVLGLLYFWADMSRNPFAYERLASASFAMVLLFLWMKFWQVVFARKLRAAISVAPAAPWSFSRCRRVLLAQAAFQPWGLFLVPLSLVPALPFAWAYAFFQNVTAFDDGESPQLRELLKKSMRQAALWPGQNHVVLMILAAFALGVFLNWTIFCVTLPSLVKTLFGVETVFSRSGFGLLNTTFFAAMLGLTYLCVDPIAKTIYVLRCFYGESVDSGEDLKVELKQFALQARPIAAVLALVLALTSATSLDAAEVSPPAAPGSDQQVSAPGIAPPALDRAIEGVIQQRKYTWRVPREKVAKPDTGEIGIIERFFDRVKKWLRASAEWLGDLLRKLFARQRTTAGAAAGYGWILLLQVLLYALVAVAVIGLGFLLFRILQNRRRPTVVQSEAIQPAPDVADENVGADQLPEDGWSKLARELLERGELRLAMRAFYLSSLAHLAGRNLIRLAKFKSNRDYEVELRRRGHSFATLLAVFGENVAAFDRIWYGMHEVTRDLAQQFAANVERIKGGG
jgi:hypothetical protein